MKKLLLGVAAALAVTGCSTMHFDNGSQVRTSSDSSSWHHTAVFALVEVTAPVELDKRCRSDEWSSVKTEQSFLNGLAGGAVNAITVVPVWTPLTVDVACSPLRTN